MDALKGLITNVPDWIKRLDDLSSQIDQRQLELAKFVDPPTAAASSSTAPNTPGRAKSIRNKGSTESLKPQDEGAAFNDEPGDDAAAAAAGKVSHMMTDALTASPTSPGAGERARLALLKQTTQVAEVAQARARATLRKRNKRSDSVASADAAAPKYRTRSMIIVYYDSYVQSFFEELVKFVSAQRNLMRKAKMAAKVAHIKRMAELEMPDTIEPEEGPPEVDPSAGSTMAVDNTDGPKLEVDTATPATKKADGGVIAAADPSGTDELPKLNYRRTLNMRSPGMMATGRPMYLRASGRESALPNISGMGGMGGMASAGGTKTDVYDELDRGLEYVQSMCEHAAHQFLRDGDCNEEIGNVKRRLAETKEQADREMERVKKEEPEALKALDEPLKTRSFRPQSMRRDAASIAASAKEALLGMSGPNAAPRAGSGPIVAAAIEADTALEVVEGIDDMDADVSPPLMYKSSRMR
ncbi:hypothetical protein Sste5346_009340 [Sporothrix stenoceras]|uniref:Uncharacterized protein n=1 Tax=Sporothrix stenoceras TaxID=5173 RepID=A0ABR3YKD2_9PEZI